MTANQKKSRFIEKKDAISLIFKDILCPQNSLKYFSPFFQIFDIPKSFFISQGNQSPNFIKHAY